jgi:iron complex transport system substrate-binding protein
VIASPPRARRLAARVLSLLILVAAVPLSFAGAATVTDDLGREVRVDGPARRIVSLAPNLTEIVFALGLGDRLVGRTDFCDFPEAARRVASVGGVTAPSQEQVLALRPDLVLGTTVGNGKAEVLALARLGVPVVVTDPSDIDGVARSFELVARAADVPAAGERLAGTFRARLAAVRARVAGRAAVRTLLVVWPEPLVVAGPRSFLSRLLEAVGGSNVLAGGSAFTAQYPTLGLEALVDLAPEAIVLAAYEGTTRDALARLRRLSDVPAVRDDRIVAIDQTILVRPGPRLADAAEQLAAAIHGVAAGRAAGESGELVPPGAPRGGSALATEGHGGRGMGR